MRLSAQQREPTVTLELIYGHEDRCIRAVPGKGEVLRGLEKNLHRLLYILANKLGAQEFPIWRAFSVFGKQLGYIHCEYIEYGPLFASLFTITQRWQDDPFSIGGLVFTISAIFPP